MSTTHFLAQVLGWYFVIIGTFVLIRKDLVRGVMEDVLSQRALVFVVAIMTLILGLVLVASHNIWIMAWPVIITILAWLVLIGGLMRLFFPEKVRDLGHRWLRHSSAHMTTAAICILVGLSLLFKVYFV